MSSANGAYPATPYPLISDLLNLLRAKLLDAMNGPRVAASELNSGGATGLADVRIRGLPSPAGTLNWVPGETGFPFALLDAGLKKASYPVTRQVWEDWQASLEIGLTTNTTGWEDYKSLAWQWEAVMQQWFTLHRGLFIPNDPPGMHYVEYYGSDIRIYHAGAGIATYGPVFSLRIHNELPVTWGR